MRRSSFQRAFQCSTERRNLTSFAAMLHILSVTLAFCSFFSSPPTTHAFSPTPMGLGAIFFRPRGMSTKQSLGDDPLLVESATFFTEAFWAAKVGGGVKVLSDSQKSSINAQQLMEFRKRYGFRMKTKNPSISNDRRAELLVCQNGSDDIMGCAGIEVDKILEDSLSGRPIAYAPLMSNLAVGRKFRRKGIAEELVKKAEQLARLEWGYDECYLYVEKRNVAAVKLYRKMGYRTIWEDDSAVTLMPQETGGLKNAKTVIVCMKKRLNRGGGLLGLFFRTP